MEPPFMDSPEDLEGPSDEPVFAAPVFSQLVVNTDPGIHAPVFSQLKDPSPPRSHAGADFPLE